MQRKLVEALLRNPAFTRGVQEVHKRVHTLQHGKPPQYHSPTQLEGPEASNPNGGVGRLVKLFWEELKTGHKPETKPPPGKT